ncbi:hypothetical protein ACFFUB_01055 [Algimonas porphyrae]|uniref:DNA-binding protein n=1 Tax=Algimonas porphyrae TaxID=1128113 RepID=A0ABQ5UZQ5_9PROT|nr:hypothetical protein [Algimonas porphyrae]GLQ20623.1 hypothetical protein GCM10007854_15780 [Algimonas porphyrae]
MAKSFSSTADAEQAVYKCLEGVVSVHDITSKFSVNTYRLYEAVDGETFVGARERALERLAAENPKAFSALPKAGKLRRGVFGKPIDPLPLFE